MGPSSITASNATASLKAEWRIAAVPLQQGNSQGAASSQTGMPGFTVAAAQGTPANTSERKRSSYVLQFPSSSTTAFSASAALATSRRRQQQQQQQQQQMPRATDFSVAGAADAAVDDEQQLEAALSPDAPDSPKPGQALLDAGWAFDEDQQQQVNTVQLIALQLIALQSDAEAVEVQACLLASITMDGLI
jgi:hypothetical protein